MLLKKRLSIALENDEEKQEMVDEIISIDEIINIFSNLHVF